MYLENISFDALEPQYLGRFWQTMLGAETLTDAFDLFECRLAMDPGPTLDLCFCRVPEPPTAPRRLHLDLLGGAIADQDAVVARAVAQGARPTDIGQGTVPWVVLDDLEGNPFCVMEYRPEYQHTGPIAGIPIDSADPAGDADFWAWLTGWEVRPDEQIPRLRHRSGFGPWLELCPEPAPKPEGVEPDAKNQMHLDIRLEAGDDADQVAAGIVERGGSELEVDWGELPWRVFADPSGNEFCVLPSS